MHKYKNLIVWQKSRVLVKDVYDLMNVLPEDEKFGLVSQIKRATVSVVSNIAEGSGRSSDKDFIRFLDIANGSAFELEAQFYLSFHFNFINEDILNNFLEKITEVQKLIYGFREKLIENLNQLF